MTCFWRRAPDRALARALRANGQRLGVAGLSHAQPARVAAFVEEHVAALSFEGLSYAIARLPLETKARLKRLYKQQG